MAKIIEVRFYAQNGADELYIRTGAPKRLFVRQLTQNKEKVVWATATKWRDVIEADKPLKEGVTIRVVSGRKKEKVTLYEETMLRDEDGLLAAEKKEFFACEQLKNAAKSYAKDLSLYTYESWSKWLLNEGKRYDYDGYSDNWLHFGTDIIEQKEVETIEVMGITYRLRETEWSHKVCGKTWKVYELLDCAGSVVELCGIAFEP